MIDWRVEAKEKRLCSFYTYMKTQKCSFSCGLALIRYWLPILSEYLAAAYKAIFDWAWSGK